MFFVSSSSSPSSLSSLSSSSSSPIPNVPSFKFSNNLYTLSGKSFSSIFSVCSLESFTTFFVTLNELLIKAAIKTTQVITTNMSVTLDVLLDLLEEEG
uniref:Wsv527 n=1 Tax=White spot syndrome virus TaxID=92652 RepID=A0A2U9G9B5_WSSV|nr:wsv527 [Shrimp white spot syndrome virus]